MEFTQKGGQSPLIAGLIILGIILPPWITLTFGYLLIRSLAYLAGVKPLLTLGPADLYIADVFLLGVFSRFIIDLLVGRIDFRAIGFKRLPGFWAYLIVMLLTTLTAYMRFGIDFFLQEIVSLLRFFIVPISFFLILGSYKLSLRQLRKALVATSWLGYLAAATIYMGVIMGIGEINLVERDIGIYRYQGILGDSVKLFLLPFIFWEFISGRTLSASFLVVALLLTGGRFGFIGLVAGILYVVVHRGVIRKPSKKTLIVMIAVIASLIVGFSLNLGGIRTRFFETDILKVGVGRRFETWKLGILMGKDFWLTGAGYTAYRLLFPQYSNLYQWSAFPFFSAETYSQILKSWVDGGGLGVFTFLWMMTNFLKLSRLNLNYDLGKNLEPLKKFIAASRITVAVFLILSPFVVWLNAGSKVGCAFMVFMALTINSCRLIEREASN